MDQILTKLAENSVFLALLVVSWMYWTKATEKKEEIIKSKDNDIKEIHEKVLEAFKDQTKMSEQVKGAVANNTEVVKTLSDRIYSVLTDRVTINPQK